MVNAIYYMLFFVKKCKLRKPSSSYEGAKLRRLHALALEIDVGSQSEKALIVAILLLRYLGVQDHDD